MCTNARFNGKSSFDEWQKDWLLEERYNFRSIENKWQNIWTEENAYKPDEDKTKSDFCAIDYFSCFFKIKPYLYRANFLTALDIISRKKLMEGYRISYPLCFKNDNSFNQFVSYLKKNHPMAVNGIFSCCEAKFLSVLESKENKLLSAQSDDFTDADDIIDSYGIDAYRLYEMFTMSFGLKNPSSDEALNGIYRFINKIFSLFSKVSSTALSNDDEQIMHKCILEVSERIDKIKFNTAVSALMSYTNYLADLREIPQEMYATLLKLISPFAPHMAEEMWARLGYTSFITHETWPMGNPDTAKGKTCVLAVQINGKTKGIIEIERTVKNREALLLAKALDKVSKQLQNVVTKKIIIIPDRIINIVVQ